MSGYNFDRLRKNITDVIKESQIKIGFSDNPVGLYYPLNTLNRMLGTECTNEEMLSVLKEFSLYCSYTLGKITITTEENDRFCLCIPPEGVRYVHENVQDSGFLRELTSLVGRHDENVSVEQVLEIFGRYSDDVRCIPVKDDEFDYLVYFGNGIPDDYRYCISFDMGHLSYHRLSPEDFEELGILS